jgi:3-phenylpropionate/trans-cinnamate dioxygenase ferredoxin reductase component
VARHVRALSVLEPSDHVVVVGAGFGGWRFVEALRREGFEGAITLLGDEVHAPYDRPPLSKQVLSLKWDVEKATLATPDRLTAANVDLRLGVAAVGLDIESNTVHLADGSSVSGTHIVIATGTRARRLPFSADDSILSLRNRDDEMRLRSELEGIDPGSVIAIIGGGFVGAEVATQLQGRGFQTLVLEAAERPLIGVVGAEVSSWLERLAGDAGVELRSSQHIADVVHHGDGYSVVFEDGTTLAAALVVLAVGAVVNVEWLEESGLVIDNGVVVDMNLLATERIAAIGDVARFGWPNVMGEDLVRVEHWEAANMHAQHLAHFWTTGASPEAYMIPYFWSDQYGKKIQMLGHPNPDDDVVRVHGTPEEGKWVALFSRGGVVSGVIALGQPRALMLSKPFLERPTTLARALEEAPWAN